MNETTITLKYEWDMGHRLPLHNGKCQRLHGHRYVAEIDLTGPLQEHGSGTGMVLDFYVLKQAIEKTIGFWDHRTMLSEEDPLFTVIDPAIYGSCYGPGGDREVGVFRVPFMPTAENIARDALQRLLVHGLPITRVRVYETPNGWAEVRA